MSSSRYGTGFVESEAILAAQAALEEHDPGEPGQRYLEELIRGMTPVERSRLRRAAHYLEDQLERLHHAPTVER